MTARKSRPWHGQRRSYEALQAETRARHAEAALIFRQAWEREQTLGGFIDKNARELVERLIAKVEEG